MTGLAGGKKMNQYPRVAPVVAGPRRLNATAPRMERANLASSFGVAASDDAVKKARACLILGETLPFYQEYRRAADSLQLPLRPKRIVDLGCGMGATCFGIASQLGADATVVGVDVNPSHLGEARSRARCKQRGSAQLEFVQGSLLDLPFPAASFDAVRIERVLQHIESMDAAVNEICRILRLEGNILVVEPDWAKFFVSGTPLDQKVGSTILQFWLDSFNNPFVTCRLPRMLEERGFCLDARQEFCLDSDNSFALGNELFDFTTTASEVAKLGLVTTADAHAWVNCLVKASAKGELRWRLVLQLFGATKR